MNEVPEGAPQAELSRLVIKLDIVHWPFDNNTASRILQGVGYASVEERPEFVRATKPDGEFFMDRIRHMIRLDGFPPCAVVGAMKSFEESLRHNTGVVLDDHAAYYESEYILIYLAKKSINDVLINLYEDSDHMRSIRNIVGKDARPYCIDVSSHGGNNDKTWFRIRIEPRVEGTDMTYFCSAAYRNTTIDSAISNAEGAPEVVKKLLCMLEGRTGKGTATRT